MKRDRLHSHALSSASERLLRARSPDEISAIIQSELIHNWGLERAYLAVLEPAGGKGLCLVTPNELSQINTSSALPLPERFAPGEFAPVERALNSRELAWAHDRQAKAAQRVRPPAEGQDRRGEAGFWSHYGIEAIFPLAASNQDLIGLLLLGCREGRRPLRSDHLEMLSLLSRQVAIAIENTRAFEKIQQDTIDLEHQVADRTAALSSARKHLEDMQWKLVEVEMQAKLGRLIAGIVHEVNTPLGTMRSSVDTLQRAMSKYRPFVDDSAQTGDPGARQALRAIDAQKDMIEVLKTSSARLTELLDGLKRFVGLDEAEFKEIDIRQSIDDAIALVMPPLADRIRVIKESPPTSPRVRCCPAKLNQVFVNLLQNAAGSIEGQGEIHVRISCVESRVRITVKDNGRGIPPGKLEHVTDFAFTLKQAGRVGLRLGLPMSKKSLVEIGGSLSITSVEGQGTTVVVELPESTS